MSEHAKRSVLSNITRRVIRAIITSGAEIFNTEQRCTRLHFAALLDRQCQFGGNDRIRPKQNFKCKLMRRSLKRGGSSQPCVVMEVSIDGHELLSELKTVQYVRRYLMSSQTRPAFGASRPAMRSSKRQRTRLLGMRKPGQSRPEIVMSDTTCNEEVDDHDENDNELEDVDLTEIVEQQSSSLWFTSRTVVPGFKFSSSRGVSGGGADDGMFGGGM